MNGQLTIIALLFIFFSASAQKQFTNVNELLDYFETNSIDLQQSNFDIIEANKAQNTSIIGVFDPQVQTSMSFINNIKLPVSILPAEFTGGQPGQTTELKTGTQYNTNAQQQADIKLINQEGWKTYQLAKVNSKIQKTQKEVLKKELKTQIAAFYYEIVQLNSQLLATKKSKLAADTLLQVAMAKYNSGLVKYQDVNDANYNLITVQENQRQIEYSINQTYISLKKLTDIPQESSIKIEETPTLIIDRKQPQVYNNDIEQNLWSLKEAYARLNYQKNTLARMPTLSLIASNAWNQYNQTLTVFNGKWINNNYLGVKINFSLPNSNSITQLFKAKIDAQRMRKSAEEFMINQGLEQKELEINWQRKYSQTQTNAKLLELQQSNFKTNTNLYNEGQLPIDKLITSFTNLVNAEYNLIASLASLQLAQIKIEIYNQQ